MAERHVFKLESFETRLRAYHRHVIRQKRQRDAETVLSLGQKMQWAFGADFCEVCKVECSSDGIVTGCVPFVDGMLPHPLHQNESRGIKFSIGGLLTYPLVPKVSFHNWNGSVPIEYTAESSVVTPDDLYEQFTYAFHSYLVKWVGDKWPWSEEE